MLFAMEMFVLHRLLRPAHPAAALFGAATATFGFVIMVMIAARLNSFSLFLLHALAVRRTAKLATPDNQCLVQQTARL